MTAEEAGLAVVILLGLSLWLGLAFLGPFPGSDHENPWDPNQW